MKRQLAIGSFLSYTMLFALLMAGCLWGPEFSVQFDKEQPIRKDDPVVVAGIPVGKVTNVSLVGGKLTVKVRLNRDQAQSVPSKSVLYVEQKGAGNPPRLVVKVLDPNSPPVKSGDILEGADSTWELALKEGSSIASNWLDQMKSEWKDLSNTLSETIDSVTTENQEQNLKEELDVLSTKLNEIQKNPESAKQKLEEFRKQLEPVLNDLIENDLKPAAQKLQREFEKFAQKIEESQDK